jgi:hypothetical protein
MIRTIEVLFVIIILSGAFIAVSYFTVLPPPREVSPINLRRLSFTTLETLDSNHDLSRAAFETDNSTVWAGLQVALSASLPPDVIYNLTVYDINYEEGQLYNPVTSISNTEGLGITNDVSTYTVASSNVTFNVTPEKIGERGNGGTLYILNCSDANGWWITGYTAQSLAQDLYNLLSPYFVKTIMVQNTSQLALMLTGTSLQGETVRNAVVINTYGEAVPIPITYCQAPYSTDSYAYYSYFLGQQANMYNWTWASIVGYPFYYVSNTVAFASEQNNWGIYGMKMTAQGGSRAFLQGLDKQPYNYDASSVTKDVGSVTLTSQLIDSCNYYGIYPSSYQTSTRALSNSILQSYNLTMGLNIFNPSLNYPTYNPGSIYNHKATGSTNITGSLLALGLTRTPDVRVTGLSLLSYYQPRLYASEYTVTGTSRIVILQLGLVGSA